MVLLYLSENHGSCLYYVNENSSSTMATSYKVCVCLCLCRPHMLSDSGHLIFTTGNNKEIRFQTSESGRVKVNNEDLTQLLSQVNFRFYLFIIHQILELIIKAD